MSQSNDPFEQSVNPYQAPTTESQQPMRGSEELANRSSRLAAVMIDGILSMLITLPVLYFTGFFERAMAQEVTLLDSVIQTLFGLMVFAVLHGYLLATSGQTIGKMIVGVRIVDFQSGKLVPIGKLIGLRYLPVWIVTLIPYVGNLLILADSLAIFTDDRRCIHDRIAGTKVIKV